MAPASQRQQHDVAVSGPERLVDLALQNLIALPTGNKSVRSRHGTLLPQWLTPAYLEALITKVNIGQVYPELIKNTLLGAPLESLRRQNLFTSHLRVELPLRALQQKIRHQAGVDELGYRYVAALVQPVDAKRWVDGQEIVIRPLAFKPGLTLASQVVATAMSPLPSIQRSHMREASAPAPSSSLLMVARLPQPVVTSRVAVRARPMEMRLKICMKRVLFVRGW